MKEFDVVALGELLIDFTENGYSKQNNPMLEANPGGAPCNVLACLSQFGKKTAFIGKVGDDNFGHMLRDILVEVGIETSGLRMDEEVHTTLAFVHTKPGGDRDFSFYRNPGADMMLREDEVDIELVEKAKIFHFGTLSMTSPGVEKATKVAIAKAKEAGSLLSFDPNLRPPLWKDLADAKEKMAYGMSVCDILKISDNEIQFFTGEEDILKGIEIIRNTYQIPLVCATLGPDGSYAFYKDLVVKCDPFLNKDTIETTGAGDTFMGCVLKSVLETGLDCYNEEKLYEMLTCANAAASLITTRRGALRVMPTASEVSAYMKRPSV